MPKIGNWKKAYGSWEGFVKVIHRSIGRKLGSGIISLKCPRDSNNIIG